MTIKEKYDRIVAEYGTAIILVKKQIVFKKSNGNNEENIYLHSFKLDTFLETDKPIVICSIYSASNHQFYKLQCTLKLTPNHVWEMNGDDLNSTLVALGIDSGSMTHFNNLVNTSITEAITSFLPSENNIARRFWTAMDYTSIVLSSENVGLLTNSLVDHMHTKEENFYLSDKRIQNETQNLLSKNLTDDGTVPGMTTPNGTVHSIELNGAFRISFT